MRGAVVGGSGAVNGGYFCRALPADFDSWALPGWSWDDVLPHFRAIENDMDFDRPAARLRRSDTRPACIRIRRLYSFFRERCDRNGIRVGAGHQRWRTRGADVDGGRCGTTEHQRRQQDRTWRRLPSASAEPCQFDVVGRHAGRPHPVRQVTRSRRGVCPGRMGWRSITADRIVLCSGAIGSAHTLLLSGIGPDAVLAAAGIPVVSNLPVGARTSDHPEWVLPVDWTPTHDLPPLEAVLTTPNGLEVRPYTRGFGAMVEGAGEDPADRPHIGVALMQPRSRGRVSVVSDDPDVPPLIEHRYDSDPHDVASLSAGAELARELAESTTKVGRGNVVDIAASVWDRADGGRGRRRRRGRRAVPGAWCRRTMGGRRFDPADRHQPRPPRHHRHAGPPSRCSSSSS